MPILKISIDGENFEFKIMPINRIIKANIAKRYSDKDYWLDRPGFLSHIVREPKMTRKEWGNVPTSLITRIIRSINHYTDSVFYKKNELRRLYVQINVFEDEIDDLYRFLQDGSDDWAWERIRGLEKEVDFLKEEKNKIEKSLNDLNEDKVIFEEGKEIDYDVQPLQLENS